MGISREQALDCLQSDDLIGIGMEADAVRRRLHPEGVVTYATERRIDCSELREANNSEREFEPVYQQAGETLETGETGVVLAGFGKRVEIGWFERLLAGIKQRLPSIWLQALIAPEIAAIAKASGLSLRDTISRLRDAGLDSISRDSMDSADPELWLEVHRVAHGLGMRTAAAMVFGGAETIEHRVDCLEAVRRLQEETGGFAAFIPVSFQSASGRNLDDATAVESLKMLAVSRMMLDNVEHMQSSWATQGLKVRQMGLRFGGNDAGSVMLGESGGSEEDLRRVIRDAGFMPVRRDSPYRTLFLN